MAELIDLFDRGSRGLVDESAATTGLDRIAIVSLRSLDLQGVGSRLGLGNGFGTIDKACISVVVVHHFSISLGSSRDRDRVGSRPRARSHWKLLDRQPISVDCIEFGCGFQRIVASYNRSGGSLVATVTSRTGFLVELLIRTSAASCSVRCALQLFDRGIVCTPKQRSVVRLGVERYCLAADSRLGGPVWLLECGIVDRHTSNCMYCWR